MTNLALRSANPEPLVAAGAVGLVGCGAVGVAAGALGGGMALGVLGGAMAAVGVFVLLAGGWIDWMTVLVLSLAAPAPFASASLRLAPAAAVTAVVVFAWCLRSAFDRRPLALGYGVRTALAALFAAVMLSAALSANPAAGAREVLNWALLLAVLAIAVTEFRRNPRRMHDVALVIATVMAVGGVLAVCQAVGILPSGFRWGSAFNRATLGFGWPNELGMFMAIGLPFSVHATRVATGRFGRAAAWMGVLATIGGLAASFSRGSWVAVTLATLILFARGERKFAVRIWGAILIAAVGIDLVSGGAVGGRFTSIDGQLAVGQRFALTLTGLLMFRANPLVGVGPGGFEGGLAEFGPRIAILWDYVGSAHNLYVHMAAETGILGLAALVSLLILCAAAAYRGAKPARAGSPVGSGPDASLRRAILWSFSTVCVVGLFEWTFSHGVGQMILIVGAMALAGEEARG